MLKSLIGTGVSARLTPEKYTAYNKEVAFFTSSWEESLSKKLYSHLSVGMKEKWLPAPYNQKQYPNIVYDYRGCFSKGSTFEEPEEPYKTIAIGGSIPCAMSTVYEYFNGLVINNKKLDRTELLLDIGANLVNNGYRTQETGTLWIAMDKLFELEYGIETEIQRSIFEVVQSVCQCHPVVGLVPTSWLHSDDSLASNEAVTIWAVEEDTALITTTTSDKVEKIKVLPLLQHTKRAWACHKKVHA